MSQRMENKEHVMKGGRISWSTWLDAVAYLDAYCSLQEHFY